MGRRGWRVVFNEAFGGGRDYFLCFLLAFGVESALTQFCSERNVHSSLQYGSLLKLSNSLLCVKKISVLHASQLVTYLECKFSLPGVGLAMELPCGMV